MFKELVTTLNAAGVINNLVYNIDEDGRECLMDGEGYALCWKINPMEFTFKETIALGTPTLPSIVIGIKDPNNNILISMEIPYTDALFIFRTAIKKLEAEYMSSSQEIINYVQMNNIHAKAVKSIPTKNNEKENKNSYEDDRSIM